ncbi:thymidylate kinase [Intrasporangium oryzae NRRL B-24470]|uniref:Thymidylate kinase n=1 Tax=Intrasporangium oryzae NRRL B-24470 TaxID=1386089 RepID=W9G610_9MICO|nr:MFS transporter [Intrasporangium oryzae]EWT00233.1 thymidylate kinase [Intrasporangium oryzae NRRL B-24470]
MTTGKPPHDGDDVTAGPTPASRGGLRAILAIRPFRNLWAAGALSSLGDWLALLATTALAAELARGGVGQYLAVSGVFILRIAPAIVLGPLAGVVADRLDRRITMIVGDLLRFALFVSIPVVGTLWWMYVAIVIVECVSLFWNPAKDATVPNLVPPAKLELANQLNLVGSYGTAPIAALLFSGLALVSEPLRILLPALDESGTFLAIYVNALTFLVSAWIVSRVAFPPREAAREHLAAESVYRTVANGLLLVKQRPFVRGLVAGMLGAFAGGGLVIGLATRFVADMGAGAPGYGLLFMAVFTGMAFGLVLGPRLLAGFSRPRLFGAALTGAGIVLLVLAVAPVLLLVLPLAVLLGCFVGVGWVIGYTLLGLTVEDEIRGRTFALVQSLSGVVLVLVLAVAPLMAAAFDAGLGLPRTFTLGPVTLTYTGAMVTYLLAGLAMVGAGVGAWRSMNDRPGVSLVAEAREVRRQRHDGH